MRVGTYAGERAAWSLPRRPAAATVRVGLSLTNCDRRTWTASACGWCGTCSAARSGATSPTTTPGHRPVPRTADSSPFGICFLPANTPAWLHAAQTGGGCELNLESWYETRSMPPTHGGSCQDSQFLLHFSAAPVRPCMKSTNVHIVGMTREWPGILSGAPILRR